MSVDDLLRTPDSIRIEPDSLQNRVKLIWQNPTHTIRGHPVPTLGAIYIWRNSELIAVLPNESAYSIKDTLTFIDEIPRPDYYRYQICVADTLGRKGEMASTAEMWLGGNMTGILVWELDKTPISSQAVAAELQTIGYGDFVYIASYSGKYPLETSLDAVFVCLGIFPNNHVLTDDEGLRLRDYLLSGGNVYLEGGDTWCFDPQTAVHGYFQIQPIENGTDDLLFVSGQPGTSYSSFLLSYNGENQYIDEISATPLSTQILFNPSDNKGTAVIHQGDGYKTIGTSFEFGGLVDQTPPSTSTKNELLKDYLSFFGFFPTSIPGENPVASSPATFALEQNYPNPFNPTTTIRWQLPVGLAVNLSLYNIAGQRVAELIDERQPAGIHELKFDASHLTGGVYFYRLQAGDNVETRKMVLIK
ncbi:MAG: T9SS type A sorting domain-containing protein [bacterium]|nr:MAG: T9SS type A sorting domain-containing protein [bacterium]